MLPIALCCQRDATAATVEAATDSVGVEMYLIAVPVIGPIAGVHSGNRKLDAASGSGATTACRRGGTRLRRLGWPRSNDAVKAVPPRRRSGADDLPLRIEDYVIRISVLHIFVGVAERYVDAFHTAISRLLRAHQQAGDTASRTAVLTVEVDVLIGMVEDQPSAAACARRAYEFAILRVPIRLAKGVPVGEVLSRLDDAPGRKSGPEAKARVIPLKTTAPTSKQLFLVITLSPLS